jgi:hypothetical protein
MCACVRERGRERERQKERKGRHVEGLTLKEEEQSKQEEEKSHIDHNLTDRHCLLHYAIPRVRRRLPGVVNRQVAVEAIQSVAVFAKV